MYLYTLQFLLLSCVSQLLDAAPGNLPFEVDMDSGNTGIDTGSDNTLTAQASKQEENFVASPKPADITQDFSFDSEPETPSKSKNKPTKTASVTTNSSPQNPTSISDTASTNVPPTTTGAKQKRKPSGELAPSSAMPPMNVASMLQDPFFAYALKEFWRQQQLIMSLLSSDLMGTKIPGNEYEMMNPMFPFAGSSFPMTNMPDMDQLFDMNNMELVEDRIIDDTNGKGHLQTFKSKDGTAIVQTQTFSQSSGNGVIPTLSGEPVKASSATKSPRLRNSRAASSTKSHSPRRLKSH